MFEKKENGNALNQDFSVLHLVKLFLSYFALELTLVISHYLLVEKSVLFKTSSITVFVVLSVTTI